MTYSISKIANILGLKSTADQNISTLLIDSRSLTEPSVSLFFALKTPNNDGHRYIKDLYSRGVRSFVVNYIPEDMQNVDDANFLVVPSVTQALQAIAQYHRNELEATVIGITGSRGKTIVKEWLFQLLNADFNIVRSPRSYNSQLGVPLSIWEADQTTTLAIFEAGVSEPGEMALLEKMIKPTIGIITNIGDEHCAGFKSIEEKCNEKLQLMANAKTIIFDADDEIISKGIAALATDAKLLGWSRKNTDAPIFIKQSSANNSCATIEYKYNNIEGSISIPSNAPNDIENAITCIATLIALNINPATIADRFARLPHVDTRLNVIEGVNNCMLIYDAYTADFNSLSLALDFMNRRSTASRTSTLILSDLQHQNCNLEELYSSVARLIKLKNITRFIGIGNELSHFKTLFDQNASFYRTTDEFLTKTSPSDFNNELILIKGSADYHFALLSEILEAKKHETVLEVNLDSLVHNFNYFKSKLKPETGLVAMIKASGYGAGSLEIAKTLQSQGASYLAVAVVDEGVELRRAGITMPIMVLNPRVINYRTLFAYRLEPEIFSFEMLEEIINEANKVGVTDFPIHIKLDTGMHRLGFIEKELPQLISILQSQHAVKPQSIFSHLATADCLDMDSYTEMQLDTFERCSSKIQQGFSHHILRHILNTAGILRFTDHQYDMVRLGIGLYGISPLDQALQAQLKPVSTLHSSIISIRTWDEGITIGYSRRGKVTKHSHIATVPIGYADGIDRHLGNGNASFIVNGVECPTIGNICMDACMIDVSNVDCKVGDTVEIFGPTALVTRLSDVLGTIPYEILTSVSQRVKRIYYRE